MSAIELKKTVHSMLNTPTKINQIRSIHVYVILSDAYLRDEIMVVVFQNIIRWNRVFLSFVTLLQKTTVCQVAIVCYFQESFKKLSVNGGRNRRSPVFVTKKTLYIKQQIKKVESQLFFIILFRLICLYLFIFNFYIRPSTKELTIKADETEVS